MPAGIIKDYRYNVQNVYGIFVGINKSMLEGFSPLQGCVNDARGFMEALDVKNPVFLADEQATRAAIFKALSDYMFKTHTVAPESQASISDSSRRPAVYGLETATYRDELLIISISAHGMILPETKEFVIIPSDFDNRNRLGTCISTVTLISACSTIAAKGGKVLLLLDCCHAGGINFDISKYSNLLTQGGIACISSSSANEASMETIIEGKSHGIFSYYLIQALTPSPEQIKSPYITLRDWFDSAYEQLISRQTNKQYPVLVGALDGQTVIKKIQS